MILIKQEYIKSPLNYVGGKYKLPTTDTAIVSKKH